MTVCGHELNAKFDVALEKLRQRALIEEDPAQRIMLLKVADVIEAIALEKGSPSAAARRKVAELLLVVLRDGCIIEPAD